MTKLQTGLKRVQDMTPEEQAMHFRNLYYQADLCISEIDGKLDETHTSADVRISEASDIIMRYAE